MADPSNLADKISNEVERATMVVEQKVDEELDRLQNLGIDDLETIRQNRLAELKKKAENLKTWATLGHGEYVELQDSTEFFDRCKKSDVVICHFYRDSTFRCKIFDEHLKRLSSKHMEALFCKINAEKNVFLCNGLAVRVLPTILVHKKQKLVDRIVGFSDLGDKDDFPTELLEWRLSRNKCIEYDGDPTEPPSQRKSKSVYEIRKKTIRDDGV